MDCGDEGVVAEEGEDMMMLEGITVLLKKYGWSSDPPPVQS